MRGRRPHRILLAAHEVPILQQIARSRTLPWFQVQRARVVLAMADDDRVQTVAFQMQCDPSTVWRICRRYEQAGLGGLLADAPRSGHPLEISPPPTCSDRGTGLPGTHRYGAPHQPLDQPGLGTPGHGRQEGTVPQRPSEKG
jgi:hypothetical protein